MRGGTTPINKTSAFRTLALIIVALSLFGSIAAPSSAYTRPVGATERIDLSALGQAPDIDHVQTTSLSADGRIVVFDSDAALDPSDTNRASDIYLRDLRRRRLILASKGPNGTAAVGTPGFGTPGDNWRQTNNLSFDPSVTESGRYVAFTSTATNLVAGDVNGVADIFVFDQRSGGTERVSVASDASQALGKSYLPSISADGRFVSFTSEAPNLVAGDANGAAPDVFVHDRKTGDTELVSVSTGGDQAPPCTPVPAAPCVLGTLPPSSSISATGRWVAFDSDADDLVKDETNGISDVFVHDRKTGKTERVSVASDGAQADDPLTKFPGNNRGSWLAHSFSGIPSAHNISANGRYVTFVSSASNLVPNDRNRPTEPSGLGGDDVFVNDRKTGRTQRVSVEPDGREAIHEGINEFGAQGAGNATVPSMTPDGRYVTFGASPFRHQPASAYPYRQSVVVYDRHTGGVDAAPLPDRKEQDSDWQLSGGEPLPDVSSDGRFVSYWGLSRTAPLGSNDSAAFLVDRGPALGVGGLGGSPPRPPSNTDCTITVAGVCIPPGDAVSTNDETNDIDEVLTGQGANLYGASFAYRPQFEDLFAAIELEYMPQVVPGASPIFYGLRFKVEGKSYEVRATSLLGGTFGLFDCTGSRPACTKVADLRGGYGTTGMRVVFSLPLDEIGLEEGGELKDVEAFSGIGSYLSGATKVLDSVKLK